MCVCDAPFIFAWIDTVLENSGLAHQVCMCTYVCNCIISTLATLSIHYDISIRKLRNYTTD